ncbi:MAG: HEAT repeat domain-containing protein, partial [Pirellulaceae bacterium]|nr:HEAT repeat domain-containing protein [Pirellulaceae bacterium]
ATMRELRRQHAAGKLPAAARLFMADSKPAEELYDTTVDPHELTNLAGNPLYQETLIRMRKAHLDWVSETRDVGLIPEPEIIVREKELGSRYAILRQAGAKSLVADLRQVANLGLAGIDGLDELNQALQSPDAAIRYWALVGLGNLSEKAAASADAVTRHLDDPSAIVRIAAARALARMNMPGPALVVLQQELASSEEWVRLNAAIVLDEMDEQARPAIMALKEAVKDRQNKYVVRVANRALNELLGTKTIVP